MCNTLSSVTFHSWHCSLFDTAAWGLAHTPGEHQGVVSCVQQVCWDMWQCFVYPVASPGNCRLQNSVSKFKIKSLKCFKKKILEFSSQDFILISSTSWRHWVLRRLVPLACSCTQITLALHFKQFFYRLILYSIHNDTRDSLRSQNAAFYRYGRNKRCRCMVPVKIDSVSF